MFEGHGEEAGQAPGEDVQSFQVEDPAEPRCWPHGRVEEPAPSEVLAGER